MNIISLWWTYSNRTYSNRTSRCFFKK